MQITIIIDREAGEIIRLVASIHLSLLSRLDRLTYDLIMERGSTLTLARLGSKVTKYQGHLVVKCVLSSYFDMIFLTPELFFLLVHSGRYWYLALHSISAFFLEQNMVST